MKAYTFYWNVRGLPNSYTYKAADVFIAHMLFRRQYPSQHAIRIEVKQHD